MTDKGIVVYGTLFLVFARDSGDALGTASSPQITEETNLGTTALLTHGGGPKVMQ